MASKSSTLLGTDALAAPKTPSAQTIRNLNVFPGSVSKFAGMEAEDPEGFVLKVKLVQQMFLNLLKFHLRVFPSRECSMPQLVLRDFQ